MIPRCKDCGGRNRVYCCRTHTIARTRYLVCVKCGEKSKQVVLIDEDGYETEKIPVEILCHSTNIVEQLRKRDSLGEITHSEET